MGDERAGRDRRLIQGTAALLGDDFPLDQLIERLCGTLAAEFPNTVALVALRRSDGKLQIAGTSDAAITRERVGNEISNDCAAATAYSSGEPVLIDCEIEGRRYSQPTFESAQSLMAVPVTYRDETTGVIVMCGDEPYLFDEQDVQLLTAIARYLGIAVRNQSVPKLLMRSWRYSICAIVAVVAIATLMSVAIGILAAGRSQHATDAARLYASSQLHSVTGDLYDYIEDATQLAATTVNVVSSVRNDSNRVEAPLQQLLRSATSTSIYGVGAWYEPYVFSPSVRLFGPYVHRIPKHRGIVLTHEWMRAAYDFPNQPWFRAGVAANGHIVFTDPYFDTDHVYVSGVQAFYDSHHKLAGVVTVDSILPTLERAVSTTPSGSLTYVTDQAGRLVLTSDDGALLAFAQTTSPATHTVLRLPLATLRAFEAKAIGRDVEDIANPLPKTGWLVHLASDRHAMLSEARRFTMLALVSIGFVWLAALLAIVTLMRNGRNEERAHLLAQQQSALEQEVGERIRIEERLREYAYRDELTGLPNRAFALAKLRELLERVQGDRESRFAVLFIDIDRFNLVNNSLGHSTGDLLLTEVAKRLRMLQRGRDVLARLGGDEYLLVIENAGSATAQERAEEVMRALEHPFTLNGNDLYVSVSIGVVLDHPRYEKPEELLRDADAATFEAKRAGRATFRMFDQSLHVRAMEQLTLETDLRRGLERGEIFVEYQPIIALADGSISGFEALARWNHPTRGRVMPDVFIRVAEQSGLIVAVDEAVIDAAVTTMKSWIAEYPHLFVSVNVSAAHLARVSEVASVRRALEASGLPATALKVEITETAVMENGDRAMAVLERLRRLGVRVVMDDFGTGYSSLSYLQRLPIEELKIDRSFVAMMLHNEQASEIVRAILAISKTLELRVTAEGVETVEAANRLRLLGVAYAQGYFYGRPMDADAARRLLQTRLPRSTTISEGLR